MDGLLNDVENGVAIGYDGLQICHSNHLSATTISHSVINEIPCELNMRRKAGPFVRPPFPHFVSSPPGAIPRRHSKPPRADRKMPDKFTCQYDTLDCAISFIKQAGPAAQMTKPDLLETHRHILVHPQDWPLLGSTVLPGPCSWMGLCVRTPFST